MQSVGQLLGCDKVGGEVATRDRLELGAGEGGRSTEGEGRARKDGDGRHGVRQDLLWGEHEEYDKEGIDEFEVLFWADFLYLLESVGAVWIWRCESEACLRSRSPVGKLRSRVICVDRLGHKIAKMC